MDINFRVQGCLFLFPVATRVRNTPTIDILIKSKTDLCLTGSFSIFCSALHFLWSHIFWLYFYAVVFLANIFRWWIVPAEASQPQDLILPASEMPFFADTHLCISLSLSVISLLRLRLKFVADSKCSPARKEKKFSVKKSPFQSS